MTPSIWILSALVLLGSIDFGNTQRKQQGRNIQVNSEVKQSIHFDCPEEFGYYPHPTDCTQYYVCVFGGALLESCTGGLMYSHELQTCDWPRNVGCDGLADVSVTSPGGSVSASVSPSSRVPEQRVRYTIVPDVIPSRSQSSQPAAVVSSRGQSRQQVQHSHTHSGLSHSQQQQQQQQRQLYADANDSLPPAEEIENDRQQRVYRGQPSTVGQVQRDRDGLRHTNAIPTSSRAEKIGVISFGTQQQQQPQQHQPVQQYRNDTLYIDDSLTNDLTEKRRRKRHVKRRLPSIDSLTTGDSSISWQTRHLPQLLYQPTKQLTYQNNRQNSMELQPPPTLRYKPSNQQVDYSAIMPRDPEQSFSQNPLTYKLQPTVQLKTNPYIAPKSIDHSSGVFQYYNYKPQQTDNSNSENYAYFNLGTIRTTPPTIVYAPSNQAKVTHAYYHPNPGQPVQYYNEFRPITQAPSQYNNPKVVTEAPRYQKPYPVTNKPTTEAPEEDEKEEYSNQNTEESEDEVEEDNNQRDDSIKPEFPSPPPFFFKSSNKYESIKNPFADPNFDFDKFIAKVKGEEMQNSKQEIKEAKSQSIAAQNDSKGKLVHSKIHANIDLRTPVAFSSPSNKKKVNVKPPAEEDYYYDDEEEEIYDKQKKPPISPPKETPPLKHIPTTTHRINVHDNKKTSLLPLTERNKYKPASTVDKLQPNTKPQDEEYEYYDDYDYEEEKYEKPAPIKKPLPPVISTPKPLRVNNKYGSVSKVAIPIINKTIQHGNRAVTFDTRNHHHQTENKSINDSTPKPGKFSENPKETRTTPTYTSQHKYSSQLPRSTPRITTITYPKDRPRLLTSTIRPNRDRNTTTTRNTVTKNSSRLEDTNVNTQSHPSANSQSTLSSRTLYNGSQHYDPAQYDPYYTLYEDDVELYRDVDYTPQQQYTSSNRAQQASPQHTYRGTPAPISIKVQSAVQEEVVPQRNTAYYNTQPQDVYEPATDYHEDNYNTQVDDQNTYRQSSRQPSRADKNELSYYVATPPKTTTTIRTTSTTTTPRAIPVQKQSVISSRTNTRGRGSAHYTNAAPVETVSVNRGTPATPRSRPTLKPSTSIVSKATEFVDIYRYPPTRPEPIYPQPQVDKTAAKCRKDVCLLPDCNCGGKEIPAELPVEQVPQIVLLTFDDSVNDLNKGLYSDLFEKGRTNPNGCPISATFYVSHEWTDYSQVQNLYSDGHELASHTVSHSFGEQFSQKKWNREVAGQREILAAYGGVHLEDVRGMRAPFLSVGGNKMFKMLYDSNFTYDSSLPVYENRPPSWPYTLDYKLFHDCMIPPCPTRSYPGVWEVPMVMWQDLNGGRCSMGDACSNPGEADNVYKMIMKNFERHYTTNRAPFGLFYHAAWFTQPHHKEGFTKFLDYLVSKDDVYVITNWQAIQWVRDPTPLNRIKSFQPFQCNYSDRPKRCNNPKVCNLWHKSGVRYMKTCQPCPDIYPWTGKTGIRSSRIDNDIED